MALGLFNWLCLLLAFYGTVQVVIGQHQRNYSRATFGVAVLLYVLAMTATTK